MAVLGRGVTFGASEQVTNTKLHNLVDDGTCTEIVNADVKSDAAIVDTKLAQIATASKVSGAALASLGSIPSGGGTIPSKNGGTGGDLSAAAQGTLPYFSAEGVQSALAVGTAGQALTTAGAAANPAWTGMTTQGQIEYHNGTTRTALAAGTSGQFLKTQGAGANPVWATLTTNYEVFTGNGTHTTKAGITTLFITMIGGGGGGGGGSSPTGGGGGGGSGSFVNKVPVTVTAETGYAVVIGAAGSAGASDSAGGDGGDSTFGSTLVVVKGGKGGAAGSSGTGGAGGGFASGTTAGIGYQGISGVNGGNDVGGGGAGSIFGAGGNGKSGVGNGSTAAGYGAGGGGAGRVQYTGGAGKAGLCIVEW